MKTVRRACQLAGVTLLTYQRVNMVAVRGGMHPKKRQRRGFDQLVKYRFLERCTPDGKYYIRGKGAELLRTIEQHIAEREPKYVFEPGDLVYHPKRNLFGFYKKSYKHHECRVKYLIFGPENLGDREEACMLQPAVLTGVGPAAWPERWW